MAMKLAAVVFVCLLSAATASGNTNQNDLSSSSSSDAKVMEEVFLRSDETHKQSMESILNSMSLAQAVQSLEKSKLSTPELMQVADTAMGKTGKNLRKQP